jgi:hypothetical protein
LKSVSHGETPPLKKRERAESTHPPPQMETAI